MSRVASCPICQRDLLLPDHTDDNAQATCPECSAQFQQKNVFARELPAAVIEGENDITPAAANEVAPEQLQPPVTESQEEAAQRIEAWFRSAKTLSDLPPVPHEESAQQAEPELTANLPSPVVDLDLPSDDEPPHSDYAAPPSHEDSRATLDMNADDPRPAELDSDFALDAATEALPHKPAWDDSQHM